jgi:hypothetical protein
MEQAGMGRNHSMDEDELFKEMERIKEDIDDFHRPYSPCEYFHGRESLFGEDQFKQIVEFFREYQQKRFEK